MEYGVWENEMIHECIQKYCEVTNTKSPMCGVYQNQ